MPAQRQHISLAFPSLLLALLLTACGGSSSSGSPNGNNSVMTGGGTVESQTFFDQTLTAEDGEDIAFTVFTPENPNGQAKPLIIHGHGFGLSRIENFDSNNPVDGFVQDQEITVEIARRMWEEAGFYVISFDQRGFGDSTGTITVMDPDIDCRNISQIIDWAEANLANLGRRNNDPVIGAIGLSYGGGFQTVCGSTDKRFDALVPLATWSHLPYSLNPNGAPKNIWLDILGLVSMGNLEPYLIQSFVEATTTGKINEETITKLAGHGARSFCQQQMGRSLSTADALFIQSANDVLFNINEAVENYECWKQNGRDSHLIIQGQGHILPPLQTAGELLLYGFDDTLYCGGQLNTNDVIVDFLTSKLLKQSSSYTLPNVCYSRLAEQTGTTMNSVKYGGSAFITDTATVLPGASNALVTLLRTLPLQTVLSTLSELPAETSNVLTQVLTGLADPASLANYLDDIVNLLPKELLQQLTAPPQFIPLTTLEADQTLAGIPLANIVISGGNGESNTLYIGIGRIPAEGGEPILINEQVLPIVGTGAQQIELIGLSEKVFAGDTLGVIVYGFHPYFLNVAALTQPPIPAEVVASIQLPLL